MAEILNDTQADEAGGLTEKDFALAAEINGVLDVM